MTNFKNPNRAAVDYGEDIFKGLMAFFKDTPPTAQGVQARLLTLPEFFEKYAWQAAQRMIMGRLQENSSSWRSAARAAAGGSKVYGSLVQELQGPVGARVRQLVAYNATLISSLPADVAAHVAATVATRQQEGKRAVVSLPDLLRHVSRTRATLIARTETSKATTALTRARAEDLGLSWYVWRSSQDARVRLSHRMMSGTLVAWTDPPAPERLAGEHSTAGNYQAGDIWNCRCYPEPLLRTEQVSWPSRVYYGGAIRRVTLANFKRIANIQQPIAA